MVPVTILSDRASSSTTPIISRVLDKVGTLVGTGPRTSGFQSMYFIYVLKSLIDNSYYVGCTDNVDRRLLEHNKGLSKYTKNKKPWNLVYREEYNSLSEARRREKQIKGWKKREAIEKLINAAIV